MSSFPSADAAKPPLGSRRRRPGPTCSNARACAARVTASCAARSSVRAASESAMKALVIAALVLYGVSRCAICARSRSRPASATRSRESRASSSRSSGLASTIFSRSKPPRKGWGQPSTARAAPCVTTCRSSAGADVLPKFERLAAIRPAARSPFHATAKRCFNCSRSPPMDARCIIPPEAVIIARRIPIPLFGAGLVEAIPDETILSLADPDDRDGDGVSGRASMIRDVATGDRASDASAGKRSTRRCSSLEPMPIATRWGSRTICSVTSWASA